MVGSNVPRHQQPAYGERAYKNRGGEEGSLSPPKSSKQFVDPIDLPDSKEDLKHSRQKLRLVGVLGKVEGVRPIEEALQTFVQQITGKNPERIKIKPDDTFVITCNNEEEAQKLIKARQLFDGKPIMLEGWEPQTDPEKTVFQNKLMKVNLPSLREECVDMAEDLVAALGVLYIAPSKEDLWKGDKVQSFVVKMDAKKKPPPGVNIS